MRPLLPLLASVLSVPLFAEPPAPAERPQPPGAGVQGPPIVGVSAAEVAVDFVVRDAKGRIVRDLRPSEVEVYEDGVRQAVGVFGLVSRSPEAEPEQTKKPRRATEPPRRQPPPSAAAAGPARSDTEAAARPAQDVEREAVVALVFDRLSPTARLAARDAALDWLKLPAVSGRQVGVFRIDSRLEELQGFTDEPGPVEAALERVARSTPTVYSAAADREQLRGLRQHRALLEGDVTSASTTVASAESPGELVLPRSSPGTSSVTAQVEGHLLGVQIAMLEAFQELELDQRGVATTNGLLALVNGLRTLPGRKAVIFFSEGLALPARVVATLGSVISEANRGGVTFYAADAAGLRVRGSAEETRRELAVIAGGSGFTGPATRRLEHNEDVLRLAPESGLGALSRDTGGFLIRDTNDIAGALRRVEEELGAYYLLSYAPQNERWDGRYRRIELRVRRPGLTVQSRRGYYAVRTPMPTPILEHEAAALASLQEPPNGSHRLERAAGVGVAAATAPPGVPQAVSAAEPATTAYPPELVQALQHAGEYVAEYAHGFSDLVVEETYTQDIEVKVQRVEGAGPVLFGQAALDPEARHQRSTRVRVEAERKKQTTRADLVFVRLTGEFPWASYRDVFEVNGKTVRDHQERLVELFSKPGSDAQEQANKLLAASAAYNIGPVKRTVNLPTLPLVFLLSDNQSRFEFRLGERKTITATDAIELVFREKSRPTLVKGPRGADLPARGRFWVSPTRGTVVRSEVEFDFGPEARARVEADYRPEPTLAMWVPSEMREEYADVAGAKQRTFPSPFKGVARYGNFRRFTVRSEEGEVTPAP